MFPGPASQTFSSSFYSPEVPVKVEKALQGPHVVGGAAPALPGPIPEFTNAGLEGPWGSVPSDPFTLQGEPEAGRGWVPRSCAE